VWVPETLHTSCDLLVLVEQSIEPVAHAARVGRIADIPQQHRLVREHRLVRADGGQEAPVRGERQRAVEIQGGMIRAWRAKLQRSMWPAAVVVGGVLGEDGP
jgi:hypothetical protein